MSKGMQAALRRARVRDLVGDADAPPAELDPLEGRTRARELEELEGPRRVEAAPPVRRPGQYELELSEGEHAELERLSAEGYGFARELLQGVDAEGRISELGAWNARDALEDDTGRPWPSKLPAGTTAVLARKVAVLFNEAA